MITRRPLARAAVVAAVLVLAFPADALAYVDPGTTGLLYQVLVLLGAGVLAGFSGVRRFVRRLLGLGRAEPGE